MSGTDVVRQLADRDVSAEDRTRVLAEVKRTLGAKHDSDADDWLSKGWQHDREAIDATVTPEARKNTKETLEANRRRWGLIYGLLTPGETVHVAGGALNTDGIVLKVERGKSGKNPLALSAWEATIALPTSQRQIKVPFSRLFTEGSPREKDQKGLDLSDAWMKPDELLNAFDKARLEGREERWILTGNLLAAYDQASGGQIVQYTTEDGDMKPGILMPRDWDFEGFVKSRPVRFSEAEHVVQFLERSEEKGLTSSDGLVEIAKTPNEYILNIAAGRSIGGKYFLFPAVRKATNDKLVKAGKWVRWTSWGRPAFVDAVAATMKAGTKFETRVEQDLANEIAGKGKEADAPMPSLAETPRRQRARPLSGEARDQVRRDIQALAHRILGHGVVVTDMIRDPETGESFFHMAGMFHQGTVHIALDVGNQNKLFVLRHEAVHALRDAGVFTAGEWDILKRAALRYPMPPARMQGYLEYYNSLGMFSPDQVQELLVEEMVADHLAGRAGQPLPPIPQRIIDRIRAFLEAVVNYLRGLDFTSVQDIVGEFERGDIGRRKRGSGQERFERVTGY
jgi:hypothetical protein